MNRRQMICATAALAASAALPAAASKGSWRIIIYTTDMVCASNIENLLAMCRGPHGMPSGLIRICYEDPEPNSYDSLAQRGTLTASSRLDPVPGMRDLGLFMV